MHNSAHSVMSGKLEQICQNDKVYTSGGIEGGRRAVAGGPAKEVWEPLLYTNMSTHFTTVLEAFMAVSRAAFPRGGRSKPSVCDPAARVPLISRSLKQKDSCRASNLRWILSCNYATELLCDLRSEKPLNGV